MSINRCIPVTKHTGTLNRIISGLAGYLSYLFKLPVYVPDSLTKAVYDKSYGYQIDKHEKWGDAASYMNTQCIILSFDGMSGNQDDMTQVGFGEWVDDTTGEMKIGAFKRYSATCNISIKFRFSTKNDAFEMTEKLLYYADTNIIYSILVNGIEVPCRVMMSQDFSYESNDDNKYYITMSPTLETQIPVFSESAQDGSKVIRMFEHNITDNAVAIKSTSTVDSDKINITENNTLETNLAMLNWLRNK